MAKFERARSSEHKVQRMAEIKQATEKLFNLHTYHEISLSTIADHLAWSRANLYKYVTSKEEIFMEILTDKQTAYFTALKIAFPIESRYSYEVFAEVWSGILNSHKDYLRYNSIFSTIIETNVSLERLTKYKKNFYGEISEIIYHFSEYLLTTPEITSSLISTIQFHAMGLSDTCTNFPLAYQAARLAGIPELNIDFQHNMKDFIYMCVSYYCAD